MEVIFLNTFKEDIKQFNDKKLKAKLKQVIIDLESSPNLQGVKNLKKLKGYYSMTYRVKIDKYRLGLYIQDNIVYLTRFVKKEDISKVFPNRKMYKK